MQLSTSSGKMQGYIKLNHNWSKWFSFYGNGCRLIKNADVLIFQFIKDLYTNNYYVLQGNISVIRYNEFYERIYTTFEADSIEQQELTHSQIGQLIMG